MEYLISFPGSAMQLSPDELGAGGRDWRGVILAGKGAGVCVFGGGIDEAVEPVIVAADGTVTQETYPQSRELSGGFTVLEVATREDAVEWARRIAEACRCSQELRVFMFDPVS